MRDLIERIQRMTPMERRELLADLLQRNETSEREGPLTFAQERLWFLDQLQPGAPIYNVPLILPIGQPIDLRILEESLNEVIRRHEILRTHFTLRDGSPVQIVSATARLSLRFADFQHFPPQEIEAQIEYWSNWEAQQAFDLANGLLIRAAVIQASHARYVLMVTLHHIVADGWSMGILLREIETVYTAFSQGRASPLPPLPMQYLDFAIWQRRHLQGPILEQHLEYWRSQLENVPALLPLPTDRPRPAVQTYRGAFETFAIPGKILRELRKLAQSETATLFMVVLSAFFALLNRYTGQTDIVVGTPIANRTRADIEPLIGFFVNTLALRAEVVPQQTFRALVKRVREVTLTAYSHQDLPFARVVEELQPVRTLSHNPLFQVMFMLQHGERGASRNAAASRSAGPSVSTGTSKFDLTLALGENGDELQGAFEYSTDLFDAQSVRRMVQHLQNLTSAAAAAPDTAIGALPLMDAAERSRIVTEWNSTRCDYPDDALMHRLIEAQATRTPHARAVIFNGVSLTYEELNRRANRLAQLLRANGVGVGSRVGICMERSVELIVALLSVLKSGAAFVPLDPSYPAARLAFMARDSQIKVLISQACVLEAIALHEMSVFTLEADWQGSGEDANPDVEVNADDMAYLIYTSGSTGQPKGVMIPHRGLCNHMFWIQQAHALSAADRVLLKTPYSFDVALLEIFWPLMTGAAVVVAAPDEHRDLEYLMRLIEKERVSVIYFVASMLRNFLDLLDADSCRSLRHVFCGGEAMAHTLPALFHQRLNAQLHNIYGPTEASIDCASWDCAPDTLERAVPIGRPIANTATYVLDAHCEPVPVGVVGELYVAGRGLALGYWGQPQLTAERFIPNTVHASHGPVMYRTGDNARYRPDGAIEFLGRSDTQVKVRGNRIELGEVESAIRSCPGTRDCAVLAREVAPGDVRILAYVVSDKPLSESVCREYLREQLPRAMVPHVFVQLADLPRTANGKVDRASLLRLDPTPSDIDGEDSPPGNALEKLLVLIWSSVLRRKRLGRREDFFALGGHSLLATQIVTRLRDVLGIPVPLRLMFDATTIESLAERILSAAERPEEVMKSAAAAAEVYELAEEDVQRLVTLPGCETD